MHLDSQLRLLRLHLLICSAMNEAKLNEGPALPCQSLHQGGARHVGDEFWLSLETWAISEDVPLALLYQGLRRSYQFDALSFPALFLLLSFIPESLIIHLQSWGLFSTITPPLFLKSCSLLQHLCFSRLKSQCHCCVRAQILSRRGFMAYWYWAQVGLNGTLFFIYSHYFNE